MIRLLIFVFMMIGTPALAQERVLLLPLEYIELPPIASLENDLEKILDGKSIKVINAQEISTRLGIDLREQRNRCEGDLLCLVQVGELLEATRLVVATLKKGQGKTDTLQVKVIDVARASLVDNLRWDIQPNLDRAREAIFAGMKQLLIPPDTITVFEVEPADAVVLVYGRRTSDLKFGTPMPFWSGTYWIRVEHPGYEPRELQVTLRPGDTSKVDLKLELDPLYVQPHSRPNLPLTASPTAERSMHRKKAFQNMWAWMAVGSGAIAMAGGGAFMFIQQQQYNELAGESRQFSNTAMITGAVEASARRDELTDNFRVGELSFVSGAAIAGTAFAWMLLDAAWGGGS